MKRLQFQVVFHFVKDHKPMLVIDAEWHKKRVNLSPSSFMLFLYNNEKALHKDDLEFSYRLCKYLQKVRMGERIAQALTQERDSIWFFMNCKKFRIQLNWLRNRRVMPVTYVDTLPIEISVRQRKKTLHCTMTNQKIWLCDPFDWVSFKANEKVVCFIHGKVIFNPPTSLLRFLFHFLEQEHQSFSNNAAISFIQKIYTPHKKKLYWRIQADFSSFLPKEDPPKPILTLTLQNNQLIPNLTYKYGKKEISPDFDGAVVSDAHSGKQHKRLMDMETVFQKDLMELFKERDLPFLLENPGDIAKFLEIIVPILKQREWEVRSTVDNYIVDSEPIDLQFSLCGGGESTYYLGSSCTIKEESFHLQEIARMMIDNQGYVKTSKGFVKLSDDTRKELDQLGKLGALSSGKRFTTSEILPLISTTARISGTDQEAKSLLEKFQNIDHPQEAKPGDGFRGDLRPYQQVGLNWLNFLYSSGLGGVLADDMGLGKTVQTIAFATTIEEPGPILVVGPTNVLYNWETEIQKFSPDYNTLVYTGPNRLGKLKKIDKYDFIITSFGIIKNDIELLSQLHFKAIFVDEAQYMKNPQTRISKAIKRLQSPFRLVMTGTPIENHLQDLWNLFDFVMPNYLGTYRLFDHQLKDGHREVLKSKIRPFVLRREKREVLENLPEKTEIVLKCTLSENQKALYETVLHAAKQGIKNSVGKTERLNILTALLRLRQVCIHPGLLEDFKGIDNSHSAKFQQTTEKLIELVDEGHKVVVFTQFTSMLDILEKWTDESSIATERIDGSVSARARMDAVNRFQTCDHPSVFLISLKAGGVGLNLTAADYVIHLDPWWNPAIESQATDRVHRIGQENKVIVYKLIAADTIEEKILLLQESKKTLLGEIIDIDSQEDKKINFEELKELLF